jgi:hypothetical protein
MRAASQNPEVFMSARLPCFLGVVLVAAVPAAASALPVPQPAESCPAIDPPAVPVPAGIRAFIDPVTGKLRPAKPEEKRKIAAAGRDRSARTYQLVILPDGTRIVELDDAFLMSVVATKQSNGTLSYRCRTQRAPAALDEGK